MNHELRIIAIDQWGADTLQRIENRLGAADDAIWVLVDLNSAEPLPDPVRQWVSAGKASVIRGACHTTSDELMQLALHLHPDTGPSAPVFDLAADNETIVTRKAFAHDAGVSVLMPLYQAGAYSGKAIESIFAQSQPPAQVVVVDDGSEDDSATHAWNALQRRDDALSAVLVHLPHRGQAASRNTALRLATGAWVFYLDADDVLQPQALEQLQDAATKNPQAGMICSRCQDFISPDLAPEEAAALRINPEPYQRMLSGCTFTTWETYERVGLYDETLPSSETAQWMLRLKDAGIPVVNIDDITLLRRYHRNNFGRRDRKTQLQSYMAIIRQRRARGGK